MDESIFSKMKVKPGDTKMVMNAPNEYPMASGEGWVNEGKARFVHLFVACKAELEEYFADASDAATEDGLFWVSYPKATGKEKYDINRNSLWDSVLPFGWHPVAQVALDEKWSAVRLKLNEQGVKYKRP